MTIENQEKEAFQCLQDRAMAVELGAFRVNRWWRRVYLRLVHLMCHDVVVIALPSYYLRMLTRQPPRHEEMRRIRH